MESVPRDFIERTNVHTHSTQSRESLVSNNSGGKKWMNGWGAQREHEGRNEKPGAVMAGGEGHEDTHSARAAALPARETLLEAK